MQDRESGPTAAGSRGRIGRGQQARARIIDAALAQLTEEGATQFTMEAIATRAQASKSTLYRRWPNAAALLVDAMEASFLPIETPDTGNVRADLRRVVDHALHLLTSTPFPRLMATIIDIAERDPTLADTHAALTARQRTPLLNVIASAQARGEIRPDTDPELLADMIVGPLFYRRLVAHKELREDLAESLVTTVLDLASSPDRDKQPGESSSAAQPHRWPRTAGLVVAWSRSAQARGSDGVDLRQ